MNSWAKRLEVLLKEHDSKLYLQESYSGRLDIYRKGEFNSSVPNLICSLTDTWVHTGKPCSWGIEVILNRIKAHDLWANNSFMEDFYKNQDKIAASKERARKSTTEDFLYSFARDFAKATNEINTSTLKKLDSRRLGEKNGYC